MAKRVIHKGDKRRKETDRLKKQERSGSVASPKAGKGKTNRPVLKRVESRRSKRDRDDGRQVRSDFVGISKLMEQDDAGTKKKPKPTPDFVRISKL